MNLPVAVQPERSLAAELCELAARQRRRRRDLSLVRRPSLRPGGRTRVAAAHAAALRRVRLRARSGPPPRSSGSQGLSTAGVALRARRPRAGTCLAAAAPQRRRPGQRRRRRLLGLTRLAVLLIVVAVVVWAGARVAHATDGSEHLNGVVHVVRSGDTVWSIVVAHYGGVRHDVRQLVEQVEQANGLHGRAIRPGDRLRLPYVE